jgi:hypothetical protein
LSSRDIQAVAGDVAILRREIERFRVELRVVFERFLDEQRPRHPAGEAGGLRKTLPTPGTE